MGKRSSFERRASDFYATPATAVEPLLPHLPHPQYIAEPCAGDGALCKTLLGHGYKISAAYDLEPQAGFIAQRDALGLVEADLGGATIIVTNPPWPHRGKTGDPTRSLLLHLSTLMPTWALLNADFMHNLYADELLRRCACIVSIGRVRWIAGTKHDGKENCCWYLFDYLHSKPTAFYGRS